MSVSRLGFVSADGGGGGLDEAAVSALIAQETATFVSNPDPPNVLNIDAIPTLADSSGRVIKRSRVTITNDDELSTNKLSLGEGSYSLPTLIGEPGQILAVPTLGTELKFVTVDPTPTEIDDLQSKTQNVLLPFTTPGQTTYIGNVAAVSGLTVGLPDAPDAWNLLPGHGQQGDQLLFPGGDSSDAYWGKAPAITVLEGKAQNISYELTSPTRTEFIGRVTAENGFGFGVDQNHWTIPATKGTVTGQQMLWDNTTRETTWGDAPKLTTTYNKTINIGNVVPSVSTAFSGLVNAERFLVGSSPNDFKLGPGQGVYGDSLTWPETGSTAVWSVPPSVQTLQDQCQYMTSEPLGTDFALRVVADSLVSNTSVTIDGENPTGSYILPVSRGTPGQVIVAGGIDGSQCVFEDAVVTPTDLSTLQSKTQNISLTTTAGITYFNGRVTPDSLSSLTTLRVNEGSPTGSYYLPVARGVPGQVIGVNSVDPSQCEFQNPVVTPTDLSNLQSKTQNLLLSSSPGITNVLGSINNSGSTTTDVAMYIDTQETTSDTIPAITVGAVPVGNGYTLPRKRGTVGQFLIQDNNGDVKFQSRNTLPTTIATTAGQSLMSTDAAGNYAWTPSASLRAWRDSLETVPPTGTTISLTTNVRTAILSSIGITDRITIGPVLFPSPDTSLQFTGASIRTFQASFTCGIEADAKAQPTIICTLENTSISTVICRNYVQAIGTVSAVALTAAGTINPSQRLSVIFQSSETAAIRVHNPVFTFIAM